jgi:hypothetical protein
MNIQPTTSVSFPLNGEVNQLEIITNAFTLFPSEISVTWRVFGDTVSKDGVIILPQYIVDSWGTDDTVVKDYVLFQLGLTEVI